MVAPPTMPWTGFVVVVVVVAAGAGEEEPEPELLEPEPLEPVVGRTLPSPTDCVIPLTELVTFPSVLLSPPTLPVVPLTVCVTPP